MHRTKRAARQAAWSEKNNPFAKRWAYRPQDLQSAAENGDGSVLVHIQTDDPTDYPNQDPDSPVHDWKNGTPPRHANTLPASASTAANVKRRPQTEQIGDQPISSSPAQSIRGLPTQAENVDDEKAVWVDRNSRFDSDKTQVPEDGHSQEQGKKHRGMLGFLQGKTTDRKEAMDDNNGKTKKEKKKFTAMSQLKATLFNSWINVLLIASPVGIALHYAGLKPVAVFVVNFIAIIPLAAMLSYATEEIALRTGEVIGGLLNASFGNAVELIVSIIALAKDQILIVQTSLIGSMLSNLLLVMGMCFFAGGVNRIEQAFNMTVAQTAASLLFLAVSSLLIPTAFLTFADNVRTDPSAGGTDLNTGEAALSRGTAILLLIVYACYLFFQLKSHTKMYNAPSEKNPTRDLSKQKRKMKRMIPGKMKRRSAESVSDQHSQNSSDPEDEREEPQLSVWVAILTLAASTALVAVNAECLVDSINAITCGSGGISKNFVGLILLPIVGNAAEHATALTVAIKDKMDLAIGVAVGSSMQIALLILPLVVVIGWIAGKDDMTLYFDGFQIAVLFVAVLLVNYLIQDGKSHWLEGVLLFVLYVIIAVAAWFYPTAADLNDCPAT